MSIISKRHFSSFSWSVVRFDCSIQRTYYKTFMQKVQETEAANEDLAALEASRQTPTVSRVSERLHLLKDHFVRNRTTHEVGLGDAPYRKKTSSKTTDLILFSLQMVSLFPKKKTVPFLKIKSLKCTTQTLPNLMETKSSTNFVGLFHFLTPIQLSIFDYF